MATRRGGKCFYCRNGMLDISDAPANRRLHQRDRTREHIFPQSDPDYERWQATGLNVVTACQQCNSMKGHISPLDFLVIMKSAEGAAHLGDRLVKMGVPTAEVDAALARRKRPVPVTIAPVMKHG